MTGRPSPAFRSPPIEAMAHVYPDGSAYLEVAMVGTGNDVLYSRDQVATLKEKIAAFERVVTFEDGRPTERTHQYREAL